MRAIPTITEVTHEKLHGKTQALQTMIYISHPISSFTVQEMKSPKPTHLQYNRFTNIHLAQTKWSLCISSKLNTKVPICTELTYTNREQTNETLVFRFL